MKSYTIFIDGACLGNPGRGGWAAILQWVDEDGVLQEKQISCGYLMTTNNRMELMPAICTLESLKEPCSVTMISDSQYLCKAIEEGWLRKWIANNWMTSNKSSVKNQDLWVRLYDLLKMHKVKFKWIRGHSGHKENEICDKLARIAAKNDNLSIDDGFASKGEYYERQFQF